MTLVAASAAGLPDRMDQVRQFLAEALDVTEVARLHDLAEAARRYANSHAAQNYAAEVKLRCARRAGELLAAMPKNPGGRSTCNTLLQVGVERMQSHRWQRIASVGVDAFEDWVADTKAAGDELTAAGALRLAKTEERSRDNDLPPAMPIVGTYGVIVADPPWRYGNTATRGAAEDHYPTMTIEELGKLSVEVDEWAAIDCHLYLWTTNNFMREAFLIVDAWGFEYKTLLTWVKPQIGMGNYFRARTEHVLFCTRGAAATARRDISNVIEADRTQHSRKPDAFYDLVEAQSAGPYLEMFARSRRFGWDNWGNEA